MEKRGGQMWDTIIVGQGLAGTTLAWHLQHAGQRVLVIDPGAAVTSSKIAAGLITPITGQRLTLSWRSEAFLPMARGFYKKIEERTGEDFFFERTAIRLFKSDDEKLKWQERLQDPDYHQYLVGPQPEPLLGPDWGIAEGGGFAMHAAQLDVAAYLKASRALLNLEQLALDWQRDVAFGSGTISVGEHKTHHLISCEGFALTRNPFFSWVPFVAAKGDILTVRFGRALPSNTLHRDIWIAPTKDADIFKVGATYDWDHLDDVPSSSAREEIESKLRDFISIPYEVIDHQAAVRPIIFQSKAVIGFHPDYEGLGLFNGLGSKGSLLAPWFARKFTDFLVNGLPLPEEVDLGKRFSP